MTWRSNVETPRSASTLLPIVRILIESGALNTAYLTVYIIVLYVEKGAGGVPIVADMVQTSLLFLLWKISSNALDT